MLPPFALERYYAQYEFSARYMLSSSDCEALTLAELLSLADAETLQLWHELKLGYTETPGHPLLRQAIAETYTGFTPQEILVMAPEEAIFLLMHALLRPGDHVVCTFPGYQSLYEVARSLGCEVSFWTPDEEHAWSFNLARLDEILRPTTRLVVVNFPHNPPGWLPSRQEFAALIDRVESRGAYLLSDEMYRGLEIEPGTGLPAACELSPRAISLSGLSKTYGLPGLRIGWIASHDPPVLERLSQLKDYTTICNSAPGEILALIALRNRAAIVAAQLTRLRRNLAALQSFLAAHPGIFRCNLPLGGSVCFPRLLAAPSSSTFCGTLVQQTGIMLVPSPMFDYGDHHVRIGFGRENFPQVLQRFEKYLESEIPA